MNITKQKQTQIQRTNQRSPVGRKKWGRARRVWGEGHKLQYILNYSVVHLKLKLEIYWNRISQIPLYYKAVAVTFNGKYVLSADSYKKLHHHHILLENQETRRDLRPCKSLTLQRRRLKLWGKKVTCPVSHASPTGARARLYLFWSIALLTNYHIISLYYITPLMGPWLERR